MAFETIALGTGPDTPGTESIYSGFTKVNGNFNQLSSATPGSGASLVSITDTAANFTSGNVEGALAEAFDNIANINYTSLSANSSVGSSATQVAKGNHVHNTLNAEVTSAGALVYPYQYVQSYAYTAGDLSSIATSDGAGTNWTMTFAYNAGLTSQMTVTNNIGGSWTKTLTYVAGVLTSESTWA